jgi:hypothetical protein
MTRVSSSRPRCYFKGSPGTLSCDIDVGEDPFGNSSAGYMYFGSVSDATLTMTGNLTVKNGITIHVYRSSTTTFGQVQFDNDGADGGMVAGDATTCNIDVDGEVIRSTGGADVGDMVEVDAKINLNTDAHSQLVLGAGDQIYFNPAGSTSYSVQVFAGGAFLYGGSTLKVKDAVKVDGSILVFCDEDGAAGFSHTITGALVVNSGTVYLGVGDVGTLGHSAYYDAVSVSGDLTFASNAYVLIGVLANSSECDSFSCAALSVATGAEMDIETAGDYEAGYVYKVINYTSLTSGGTWSHTNAPPDTYNEDYGVTDANWYDLTGA